MKKSRYSEEHVMGILREAARGMDDEGGVRQTEHLGANALQLEAEVPRMEVSDVRTMRSGIKGMGLQDDWEQTSQEIKNFILAGS